MEEIAVGDSFEFPFSFTQADLDRFAEVSGDTNLIHFSRAWAERSPLKKFAIHGMMGALVFSRVLGTMFPGHGTVYVSQTLQFKQPMFIDTAYSAVVTVRRIIPARHRARLLTVIKDVQSGVVTTQGHAVVLHLEKF